MIAGVGRRGTLGALSVLALGAAVLLGAASPAAAHNYLVDSTPEADDVLTEVPERFEIVTNDALLDVSGEAAGFALQVRDADGRYYGDGCLSIAGATVSTDAELGPAGTYTLGWQVISADGHTVDGELSFTWAPPAGHSPAAGDDVPPNCGGGTPSGAAAPDDAAAPGDAESAGDAGAVSPNDVMWVLGTVVIVGVVLFGTLLILTRRRTTPDR